jgi:drug/metabolite transporter (DMT)-like permease
MRSNPPRPPPDRAARTRTILFTAFALVAFAANSVLCRLALGRLAIDAASFSSVRIIAGAVALLALSAMINRGSIRVSGTWTSAAMLFLYAVPFSFGYVSVSAGMGALLIFPSVQVTMMLAAFLVGERLHVWQWLGMLIAPLGLAGLFLPGVTAPPFVGAALMVFAGISWGIYSLRGRASSDPLADTTGNFVRAVPFVIVVSLLRGRDFHVTTLGILLAICSGAVASALGYVVWYAALRTLTASRASVVQLAVPLLTAAGGVVFLAEQISLRLITCAALIVGGLAMAIAGKVRLTRQPVG